MDLTDDDTPPVGVGVELGRLATKGLRWVLSPSEMQRFHVHVTLQHAGEVVVTPPGYIYHWTLAVGFSVAEALNFFVVRHGISAQQRLASFRQTLPQGHSSDLLDSMGRNVSVLQCV